MLNNKAIKEEIKRNSISVDNDLNNVLENSIKVTLGDTVKIYDAPYLNTTEKTSIKEIPIPEDGLILKPNELYIARTEEYTKTYGFVPMLAGREELATLGMEIHITAGFGDNGFEGTWTLEIVCANPTKIYRGMDIGKIYYFPLIGDPGIEYRGKYFRQIEPTESRLSQEYENKKKVMVKKYANK